MSHLRSTLAAIALSVMPAAASPAKPAMPVIHVTLASHHYQPNPIYLPAGVPQRLVFTNRAGKTHDFKAPKFFASARILRGAAPGGAIELAPGQSTMVELIPARGRYRVHCAEPFHVVLGMTGTIIVG